MITLSGARKGEMGFDPKPTGHGYPERAYELIAQTIAEIVSKGYPGMPITKKERANAKAFNRLSARPLNLKYYFREYKGGAIPWEKVRAVAEEHSGKNHPRQWHQGHRAETLEVRDRSPGYRSAQGGRRPVPGGSDNLRQAERPP